MIRTAGGGFATLHVLQRGDHMMISTVGVTCNSRVHARVRILVGLIPAITTKIGRAHVNVADGATIVRVQRQVFRRAVHMRCVIDRIPVPFGRALSKHHSCPIAAGTIVCGGPNRGGAWNRGDQRRHRLFVGVGHWCACGRRACSCCSLGSRTLGRQCCCDASRLCDRLAFVPLELVQQTLTALHSFCRYIKRRIHQEQQQQAGKRRQFERETIKGITSRVPCVEGQWIDREIVCERAAERFRDESICAPTM